MSDEGDKAIRVIPFDGEQKSWRMWSRKFLARADLRGYKGLLLGLEKPPKHDELTTDKEKIKLRAYNKLAYGELLLACQDEVSFGAVDEAITEELPGGDAAKAWANLVAKYEPTTSGNLVLLKKEFVTTRLELAEQDPDEWIANLERI